MITLPVSSSVYQSMVANIQQIHTNGDGTLCITPMQVQKTGHQHSINHNLNSTNISGNLAIGSNCSVAPPCISSVNGSSSYSNANNVGTSILANCNAHTSNSSAYDSSTELTTTELHCDNNSTNNNNNNNNNNSNNNSNLLELCRVLSQSTNMNSANCPNAISFNPNLSPNFTTNDRKLTKCTKKPSAINRNQFFNFASSSPSSSSFPSESNGIDRNNFIEQQIDENKSLLENDTNNNSNNGQNHHQQQSDENINSNGNSSHDLKFVNVTDQSAQKSSKTDSNTNPINITVQLGENETRTIKMECEIDVA